MTSNSIKNVKSLKNVCTNFHFNFDQVGSFYFAAKAFDLLEKLDSNNPEYWEGKRGACAVCNLRNIHFSRKKSLGF